MNTPSPEPVRLRWTPDWKSLLFTVLLLPILLSLGCWQLQRAEEKRQIQAQYRGWQASAPASLSELGDAPDNHRPVVLQGQFDPERYFLLDNRTRQGRAGFEVIGLFRPVEGGGWLPVNRGWVAGQPDRSRLPRVTFPSGEVTLWAEVHHPQALPLAAPEQSVSTGGWPRIAQTQNLADWQQSLAEPMRPFLVRLAAHSQAALVTDWAVINMRPEKHTAYAVQWFAMALALLLLFVFRNSNVRDCLAHSFGRST